MNRDDLILEILDRYRQSGRSLNEFQRRHWAATEAMKLGRGGIAIISKALRISPNTIKRGIQEIETGQTDSLSQESPRIRKPGGGRKSKKSSDEQFARTRVKQAYARDTVQELRSGDCSGENQQHRSPIPTDSEPTQVTDAVSDIGPNHPEHR